MISPAFILTCLGLWVGVNWLEGNMYPGLFHTVNRIMSRHGDVKMPKVHVEDCSYIQNYPDCDINCKFTFDSPINEELEEKLDQSEVWIKQERKGEKQYTLRYYEDGEYGSYWVVEVEAGTNRGVCTYNDI